MALDSMTFLLHGDSGSGKTRLLDTMPGKRLVFDAEGGISFTDSKKVEWKVSDDWPDPGGDWETAVCEIVDYETIRRGYKRLNRGDHPFDSIGIDSLTELQKRCKDAIVGQSSMEWDDWSALLRRMEGLIRNFRDLKMHPKNPVKCVAFTALTGKREDEGRYRPNVQGALRDSLPGFVDVVGYLYTKTETETGATTHKMLTHLTPSYLAKDRTDKLPPVVKLGTKSKEETKYEITIQDLLDIIFGKDK